MNDPMIFIFLGKSTRNKISHDIPHGKFHEIHLVTVVSPIPRVTILGISQQKSQLIFSDDDITVYFWLVNSPMLVKVKALQMPNSHDFPMKSHDFPMKSYMKISNW